MTWLAVCAAVLLTLPARAQFTSQLEEKSLPVGEFSSVSVTDGFDVALVKGTYGVKVTADKDLSPYVQVYVRAKTLYITYDEKSVPKEVKKQYKGRGAPTPVFRAVVTLPELNGLSLEETAVLSSTDEFSGSNVSINLAGKSQIKALNLKAQSITVSLKKNTQADLTLRADNRLEINTEDNAKAKVSVKAQELAINASDQSEVGIVGESESCSLYLVERAVANVSQKADKASLQVSGSSTLTLSGNGSSLALKADKSASVEASGFPVKKVEASMQGNSKANVAVSELIDATLVGGSALYYTGTPSFKIGKVIKSTLAPYGATAK